MKRLILPLSLLLILFATAPLFAVDSSERPTLVQDVIRMTQGGVSDQAIIAFVQNRRATYVVTADDMIAMTEAKVSNEVLKFVADAAAQPGQAAAAQPNDADWRNRRSTEPEEAEDARATRTRTVIAPRVYVSPWWWDPWYYYDPFWYGPRLSVGFGYYWGGYRGPFWGGRYYGGGYYGGGHYGGGHYGGGGGHVQPRPGGGGGIIRRGR